MRDLLIVSLLILAAACASRAPESKVDWSGLNYYQQACGDKNQNPGCASNADNSINAIGKGGKR